MLFRSLDWFDLKDVFVEQKKETKLVHIYLDLPLHDSQKETKRTEEYSIFEYHLKPEFDFEQEIFSNMDAMEVLEPQWLRDEVKERINNLANKYR